MKLFSYPVYLVWLFLTVGLLTGCATTQAPPATAPASFTVKTPVALPPGVTVLLIQPRTGTSLAQAHESLAQIVTRLPRPSYLPSPLSAADASTQPAQPSASEPASSTQPDDATVTELDAVPLEAQRAYVAARVAWRQQQVAEAIRQLNEALLKAPDSPEIMRFLGIIYLATGNRTRGSLFLEQAVRLDPNDLRSLYLLGRHEWEQQRWDAVIVVYSHGLRVNPRYADPAFPILMEHFLAVALERQGYDQAAAEQFQKTLSRSYLSRSTRFGHELSLLHRQRFQSYQTLGDIYCRLDQPTQALAAYQSAAEVDEDEQARASLTPRLAYVYLRLNMGAQAVNVVLDWISHTAADAASLNLVDYLLAHGAPSGDMVQTLRSVYDQQQQPASLALFLAKLMESSQSLEFLQAHVRAKPGDWLVIEHLLKTAFASKNPAPVAQAMQLLSQLIAAQPRNADQFALLLLEQAEEPQQILDAVAMMTPLQRAESGLAFLHAAALIRAQKLPDAQTLLEQSLDAQPPLPAIRLQLARIKMEAKQWEQASQLLEPLADSQDPAAMEMRIRLLQAQGQTTQALELLDRALGRDPTNPDLAILKADLLLSDRQAPNAQATEQVLLDALEQRPVEESLYTALFRLYEQNLLADSDRLRQRLLRRAQQSIPNSRIARFQTALEHAQRAEWDSARRLLSALLEQNSRDYPALDLLLAVLHRDGQSNQAIALLDQRLLAQPADRRLLMVAQRHYSSIQDQPRFLAVSEKLLNLEPAGPKRSRQLALLYLQTKRPAQAVELLLPMTNATMDEPETILAILGRALIQSGQVNQLDGVFEQAIARHPTKADELTFEWAMLLEQQGQAVRSEQLLVQLLERNPQHPMANNALGYVWTQQGKNLDRALEMIRIAMQAKPDNPAILDSMGWIYYRLGKFDMAVQWLLRARNQPGGDNPVILAHLGDALYRVQRKEEALRYWKAAREALDAQLLQDDPELKTLGPELDARLRALEQDKFPPLAPAASQPATQPTTAPAGADR